MLESGVYIENNVEGTVTFFFSLGLKTLFVNDAGIYFCYYIEIEMNDYDYDLLMDKFSQNESLRIFGEYIFASFTKTLKH